MTFEEKKLQEFDEQLTANGTGELWSLYNGNVNVVKAFFRQALKEQREEIVRKIEEYAKELDKYHEEMVGDSHEDNMHMLMYDAHSRQIAIKHLLKRLSN